MSFQTLTFDRLVTALTDELVAGGMSRADAAPLARARVDDLLRLSSMLDLLAQEREDDADCDQAA